LAGALVTLPAQAALQQQSRRTQTVPSASIRNNNWFGANQSKPNTATRSVSAAGPSQSAPAALIPGVPQPFSLPAVNGPTLFDELGYRIEVPAGAGRLQVNLVMENYETIDADLYVRFGSPISETPAGEPEFFGESLLGLEQITVSSGNGLQPGTYFIAVGIFTENVPSRGFVTATVSGDGFPGTALTPGQPASYVLPAATGPTLYNGELGYSIAVPEGATALDISIETLPNPGVNVDLFVRRGMEPVSGSGAGGVDADFRSRGPTGAESIHIDGQTNPPLSPGVYFIGLAVPTTNLDVDGILMATVETPLSVNPGGTVLSTGLPLVHRIAANSIVSVFGRGFVADGVAADHAELDSSGRITTNLAGTCLEIDGRRAPLLAVRPTQVNAQTPQQLGLGAVSVVMIKGCATPQEQRSEPVAAAAAEVAPAFFNFRNSPDGSNPIAAVHADGALIGEPGLLPGGVFTPAQPGAFISLFGTGFGPTDPPLEAGEIPLTALPGENGQSRLTRPWSLRIGDLAVPREDVPYAGVSPCCAGLYQLVFRVPSNAPDGNLRVMFTVGGVSTPEGPYVTVKRP
jgi:uncharacterized protein (TIGR03437 family)